VNELKGYDIIATDDQIGHVHGFYFDEATWTIRYMVIETGGWLSERRVLISPSVLQTPIWETKKFPVSLTKKQIENSPEIDTDEPITRDHETTLHRHFEWPLYWADTLDEADRTFVAGPGGAVTPTAPREGVTYIRSTEEVSGYHIEATDGEIGQVEDFFVDDNSWEIHYLEIDTRNWLPGKKVLIAPKWVKRFDWEDKEVYLAMTRQQVKDSPEYETPKPLDRAYETRLYNYYGLPYYWL
jgi:uncharacterized protein YrrD